MAIFWKNRAVRIETKDDSFLVVILDDKGNVTHSYNVAEYAEAYAIAIQVRPNGPKKSNPSDH